MIALVIFQIRRYERYRRESYESLDRANIQLARQIDERERAELALKESEQLFRTIFETSPDTIVLTRMEDDLIVDVNHGFTRLTGYGKDEVIGRALSEIPRWKDFNMRNAYTAALETGRPVHNLEFSVHTKAGGIRTVLVSANTVNFSRKTLLVTLARDISDLKAVENELRRSEAKFRGIFESAGDLIHLLDLDGSILLSNSAAMNHLGLPMTELRRRQLSDFVDAASRPRFQTLVKQVTETGRFNGECTVTGARGRSITTDCSAYPVLDSRGKIAFIVIFQRDISIRKQIEQKLRISYAFMKIANDNREIKGMLGQFIASIQAHTGCSACTMYLLNDHGDLVDAAAPHPDADDLGCRLDAPFLKTSRGMCARVVNQDVDARLAWFTAFGSYFLAGGAHAGDPAADGPKACPEKRCARLGYRSLALVPIRVGEQILGLIRIADTREGLLDHEMVERMETVSMHAGTAIRRLRAEDGLERAYHELERRVAERTQALSDMNRQLQAEIEERRRVEERLLKNRNTLQTVIDGIGDSLILVDTDMKLRMLNRVAAATYRVDSLDQVVGRLCYQEIGRGDSCMDCAIPRAIQRGENVTFERQGLVDSQRLERITIYPLKEVDDASGGAIIRICDITEEKRFEQQLIQSEKMASLGILVSSIGHEINNPNNFISFNIPILRDYLEALIQIADQHADTQPDFELFHMRYDEFRNDVLKLVDNIEHGSSRISSFVSNLREFSQNNVNREKEWLALPVVLDEVLSICRSQIKKRVRDFTLDIPADLPRIYADKYSLEQIMLNLIVNAVQASDKEDSTVNVSASTGDSWRDRIIIRVSDNGCGIDEKQLGKLFNPFYTTKPAGEGTGLGLYVCHNLVARQGGRIEVQTRLGEGSTFTIFLPDRERREKIRD
ncbi:PAS domain S-box protein, partial [Desulfosarcina sp.]|uniref:PAS domain S-box protein n=1 Tax=Desulfosarcina sp. TaxID=2027861 RepID=UPI003970DF3D